MLARCRPRRTNFRNRDKHSTSSRCKQIPWCRPYKKVWSLRPSKVHVLHYMSLADPSHLVTCLGTCSRGTTIRTAPSAHTKWIMSLVRPSMNSEVMPWNNQRWVEAHNLVFQPWREVPQSKWTHLSRSWKSCSAQRHFPRSNHLDRSKWWEVGDLSTSPREKCQHKHQDWVKLANQSKWSKCQPSNLLPQERQT